MTVNNRLALVLPAYKGAFLADALESLASQTDKAFRVYVGDDASPEALEPIAQRFRGRLDVVYHRFGENAGGRSMAEQWNRCVHLTSEPWVWLFSDDDVADAGCVAAWRKLLAETNSPPDVYRFQTRTIDGTGRTLRLNPSHPEHESSLGFVYHRLQRQRLSYACEYIFSRASFDRSEGFVDFPLAWCSDDASWALFARDTGIRAVPGPRVGWRISDRNISGATGVTGRALKREALLRYLEWLSPRIMTEFTDTDLTEALVRQAIPGWFWHQLLVADVPCDQASLKRLRAVSSERGSLRCIRHNANLQMQRARQCLKKILGRP